MCRGALLKVKFVKGEIAKFVKEFVIGNVMATDKDFVSISN